MDAIISRNPRSDVDYSAPLGEAGPETTVLRQPVAKAVKTLGNRFTGLEGQRLRSFVDLDTGDRAGGSDEFDERRPVSRFLTDSFVVKNDPGDVIAHRFFGAEEHLAIIAAII